MKRFHVIRSASHALSKWQGQECSRSRSDSLSSPALTRECDVHCAHQMPPWLVLSRAPCQWSPSASGDSEKAGAAVGILGTEAPPASAGSAAPTGNLGGES